MTGEERKGAIPCRCESIILPAAATFLLTLLSNVVAYAAGTHEQRIGRWLRARQGYFFFGFARTFWNARTFAWCARAAPVSMGRSLPARISFMPLSV